MGVLDSHRLHAFVAVSREGGFSRAARALGRTQSSVSEAIALLEEELGKQLFFRDARSTSLTEEGKLLLEHAVKILDEMAVARLRLAEGLVPAEGELRIGTSDTFACYLLPKVFAAYRKKHPGIQLRLDNRPSPALATEVRERRLPLGVVSLPLTADPQLRVEPITRYQDVVIVPPDHPWSAKSHVNVSQLAEQPLLLLDPTTGTRALLDGAFQGASLRIVMEARSVDVLKRLVALGFGVSVVPSMAVTSEVKARTLAAIPLRGLGTDRRVGFVTHARAPLPAAAGEFLDLARRLLPEAL